MSYFIQGSCINCGRCAAVCPVAAPASDGLQYQINKDTCLSCGACADGLAAWGSLPGGLYKRSTSPRTSGEVL